MSGRPGESTAVTPPPAGSGDADRRTFSQLLAELAASPRRPQQIAWERGFRTGEVVEERFELREPLGRGGFGVVFKAWDRKLKRFVAFKAIPPGGQSDALIQQEAEVAATLEHQGLVRLYDYGRCDSGVYLILELVAGESLARRLDRERLSDAEAVRIALEITRALASAPGRGVLHRDLKPSNVLLDENGQPKVADFGLAYYFGQGPARSGTPGYMAPEQLAGGPQDPRTDVFGVGKLLEEMISPQTAAGAVRPALERLIRRATDPDPRGRPADAEQLARELEHIERRVGGASHRRIRLTWIGLVAVASVLAVGTALLLFRERMLVAVADFDNGTGDPELDGISKLMSTSLDQWARLSVLPRQRLLTLAQPGGGERRRVDCGVAREAAQRAGAAAVLCGQVLRSGEGYSVQVERLDPADGTTVFRIVETAGAKQELPALVDRLSDRTNRLLSPYGTHPPVKPIAPQTTANLEAYHHYFSGKQCADRPVHGQDCAQELRQALALDPEFALAAYELAIWLAWNGGSLAEQKALIDTAERLAETAPRKERTLIRAWAAHLAGDDRSALEWLEQAMKTWPQDRQAFYQAGDILRHRDELAKAVPKLEGAAALEPDFAWAAGDLAQALGALGRTAELRTWAARWEQNPGPGALHGLSVARGWLGDLPGAAEAAQRAIVMGAGASGQEDLGQARIFAGDYQSVRDSVRLLATSGSSVRRIGYYGLAAVEAYEGRWRPGLGILEELARRMPEVQRDAVYHAIKADYLVGGGDASAVWSEVELARALDPRLAAEHAVSLAYLGDLPHAALLARDLPEGTPLQETYLAMVRIQRGEVDAGISELDRIAGTTPIFTWRIAPLFLLGERLALAGRDAEAIPVLRRAQALYVPLAMWRSWAYPRSLLLLARSQERIGQISEARATVDHLLRDWSRAEENDSLLLQARALRNRLTGG